MICQPQFEEHISMMDKDLKIAVFFLISLSTVIEEMTRDLMYNDDINVNYTKYEERITKNRLIYEDIYE